MWNNGRNDEFTDPMGQEILIRSTTIAMLKIHWITEDSPLFYSMVKMNYEFDKLEERMFGTPIATSPHAAHISESAPAFSQPQYERPFCYYSYQCGRQSELVSSAPETDRANSGGATTIPSGKRLSYCHIDHNGKLIFRKKPELVSSVSETDRTNSGGVSTIFPAATYTPNSVRTSRTDDGTTTPHASLPHITVLSDSLKSSSMVPMSKASCDASQTDS